jgi:fatty acid desaturase
VSSQRASWAPRRQLDYAVVLIAITISSIQVFVAQGGLPHGLGILLVVAVLRWSHLAQHSHAHTPIFGSKRPNEIFDIVIMTQTAMPAEMYRVHHILIHHKLNNRPNDWTGPFSFSGSVYPDCPTSLIRYITTFIPRAWIRSMRHLATERAHRQRRNKRALLIWAGFSAMIISEFGAQGYLTAYLGPWFLLYLLTPIANWMHHSRCDYKSWATAANSNLKLLNRSMGLNIGFHATHHRSPQTHWSEIPTVHRRFSAEAAAGTVSTVAFTD